MGISRRYGDPGRISRDGDLDPGPAAAIPSWRAARVTPPRSCTSEGLVKSCQRRSEHGPLQIDAHPHRTVSSAMLRDLRLAARMMLQAKGWTAVILVSLALGIGANTALFTAMNGLLFGRCRQRSGHARSIRVGRAQPDENRHTRLRLHGARALGRRSPHVLVPVTGSSSRPTKRCRTFCQRADRQCQRGRQRPGGNRVGVPASGNYYRALGVTARLGRTIVPDDDSPTAAPAAVISHKYWRTRLAAVRMPSARSSTSTTPRSPSSACSRRSSQACSRPSTKRRTSRCRWRSSRR